MKNKKITEIITMLLNMHYNCKHIDVYIFEGMRVNILFNDNKRISAIACYKNITTYEDIGSVVDILIEEISKQLSDLYKKVY